jgi:hypothetical protein
MKVRFATEGDLLQWFGELPFSMRAAVLVDGDRVLAVGGIGWATGHMQLFSHVSDEARPHKIALGRLAALVRGMIRGPVLAIQDCAESTSTRLLEWCGLQEVEPGVWYGGSGYCGAHGRLNSAERGRATQASKAG